MGLCQCRQLSALFCYQHKQNVCEGCLVGIDAGADEAGAKKRGGHQHLGCFVRPYLQWLSDDALIDGCRACEKPVNVEDDKRIRLPCYDVFHFDCLVRMLSTRQVNALSSLKCPGCQALIFSAGSVSSSPLMAHTVRCFKHWDNPWRAQLSDYILPDAPKSTPYEEHSPMLGERNTAQPNSSASGQYKVTLLPPLLRPAIQLSSNSQSNKYGSPMREPSAYVQRQQTQRLTSAHPRAGWRQLLINTLTLRNSRPLLRSAVRILGPLMLMLALVYVFYRYLVAVF